MNSEFWNDRYKSNEFAYGLEPNDFIKFNSPHIKPNSKILCLAEGEGRNAVYLSTLGHDVTAIDYSINGLQKTKQLANTLGVHVNTICVDLSGYVFEQNKWDVIICVFGHFPSQIRQSIHAQIYSSLKKGGKFMMEAYSQEQLNYKTGGPLDVKLLYSIDDLKKDFSNFPTIQIEQVERVINEGKFHNGLASVIQVVGQK